VKGNGILQERTKNNKHAMHSSLATFIPIVVASLTSLNVKFCDLSSKISFFPFLNVKNNI
jgi:hypothetical protein